jgi:hypothetical protein
VQVHRVVAAGTAAVTATAEQDDLETSAGGALVLVSTAGDLVLADEVTAAGAGALRLQAGGAITLHNAVDAGSGAASVVAGGALVQNSSLASSGSASIDLQAGGAVTMAHGATVATGSGNVRISAAGALQLGAVEGSEGTRKAPALALRGLGVMARRGERGQSGYGGQKGGETECL